MGTGVDTVRRVGERSEDWEGGGVGANTYRKENRALRVNVEIGEELECRRDEEEWRSQSNEGFTKEEK